MYGSLKIQTADNGFIVSTYCAETTQEGTFIYSDLHEVISAVRSFFSEGPEFVSEGLPDPDEEAVFDRQHRLGMGQSGKWPFA